MESDYDRYGKSQRQAYQRPEIVIAADRVDLNSSIINSSTIMDLFLVVISISSLVKNSFEFSIMNYLLPLLALGVVWKDFEDINKVSIDRKNACLTITTRNILKPFLFSKKETFSLKEISLFEVEMTNSYYAYRRYRIKAIFNDQKYTVLNSVLNEEDANALLLALTHIIR
ncbi:MAG: hypothetical protein QM802_04890 [Agriterribacter sp.]